jgi:hypothetical protein
LRRNIRRAISAAPGSFSGVGTGFHRLFLQWPTFFPSRRFRAGTLAKMHSLQRQTASLASVERKSGHGRPLIGDKIHLAQNEDVLLVLHRDTGPAFHSLSVHPANPGKGA